MRDAMYERRQKRIRRQQRTMMAVLSATFAIGAIVGFLTGRGIYATAVEAPESTEAVAETAKNAEPTYTSLGEFRLTAYCPCEKCCGKWGKNRPTDENGNIIVYTASGSIARQGYTIAADRTKLPFGTKVYINGREYEVQDVGGAIKENRIDIYFESHQEALEFGVQYAEVFVLATGED